MGHERVRAREVNFSGDLSAWQKLVDRGQTTTANKMAINLSGCQPATGKFGARYVCDRLLMQEKLCGLDSSVPVEPSLHNIVVEEIRKCEQAHALVMGHPAAGEVRTTTSEATADGSIISRLIESVRT